MRFCTDISQIFKKYTWLEWAILSIMQHDCCQLEFDLPYPLMSLSPKDRLQISRELNKLSQFKWIKLDSNFPEIIRSRHRRCSVKKGVLRNFEKFTGENLCQSLFFNKVEGLRRLWTTASDHSENHRFSHNFKGNRS